MKQICAFNEEVVRELYVARDQTLQEVAVACGTTIPTVRKYLGLWGIPSRKRGRRPLVQA